MIEKNKETNCELKVNPQKKRLEQLHARFAANKKVGEKGDMSEDNNKRKKNTRRVNNPSNEAIDYEYSVDEEDKDEIRAKHIKNDILKEMTMELLKLDKALKAAEVNEKRLKLLEEGADAWIKKYEAIVAEKKKHIDSYSKDREQMMRGSVETICQLKERWKRKSDEVKKLGEVYSNTVFSSSISFLDNIFHHAITVLRTILFAMAFCRELFMSYSANIQFWKGWKKEKEDGKLSVK